MYALSTTTSTRVSAPTARRRTPHRVTHRVSTVRLVDLSDQSNYRVTTLCRSEAIESSASTSTNTDQAETKKKPQKKDSLEQMRVFSERYAKNSNTYFCSDPGVTAVVIKGLAEHKDSLGAPLCPCRHYEDKEAEVAQGFWNCPCVPMRERNECHCMLFLTEDNPFRAEDASIGYQEIKDLTDNPEDI
jgi:ferredoxin-thioredoxin reductase catalytic chain